MGKFNHEFGSLEALCAEEAVLEVSGITDFNPTVMCVCKINYLRLIFIIHPYKQVS